MLEQIFWVLVSASVFPLVWGGVRLSGKLGTILTNSGILLWFLCWLWLPFTVQPKIEGVLRIALTIVGVILIAFGGAILAIAGKSILPVIGWAQADPKELVTKGIYGFVRHPIYTGCIFFFIGWYLIWGGVYALFLTPVLFILLRFEAFLEEKYVLEPKFGDEHREYRKKVPAFFTFPLMITLIALSISIVALVVVGWIPLM